jgi:hypothetical protein
MMIFVFALTAQLHERIRLLERHAHLSAEVCDLVSLEDLKLDAPYVCRDRDYNRWCFKEDGKVQCSDREY